MSKATVKLTLWQLLPGGTWTAGPAVYLLADKITGVRESCFDPAAEHWRSMVMLVGGEHVLVCEEPEAVLRMLA